MSRYIDADALEKKILKRGAYKICTDDVVAMIADAPTVDAVPVTRCMDCKHSTKVEGMIDLVWCDQLAEVGIWVENDWFCADGERKDGEHEQ